MFLFAVDKKHGKLTPCPAFSAFTEGTLLLTQKSYLFLFKVNFRLSHPPLYNYICLIKTWKSIEDVLFFSGGRWPREMCTQGSLLAPTLALWGGSDG